ncbi:MAG: glycine cleavage system protein GcvH [Spirochaetaceae bacterium]|jgi:glycine cleavage system H protein|nr:glycine cleavage system protein GcvH [Spirochaetaceae bacterium]
MKLDDKARYANTHEWARQEGNLIVVGISDHAQESLGDIVFVDLPPAGQYFKKGTVFGVVESVKAASDLYLPVSGKINAVNGALGPAPETVNKDCYGEGWMVTVEPEDPAEWETLLSPGEYEKIAALEE